MNDDYITDGLVLFNCPSWPTCAIPGPWNRKQSNGIQQSLIFWFSPALLLLWHVKISSMKSQFHSECQFFSLTLTLSVRYSSQLLNARVFLISDERCKAPLVYGSVLDNSMFCAGTLRGGIDSCQVCMFLNVKKCCDYSFLLATVLVLDMCNMHSPLSR